MGSRLAAAALVALVSLVVVGCGGGDTKPLSKHELVTRAQASCTKLDKRTEALLREVTTSAEFRRRFKELAQRYLSYEQEHVDTLAGLTPPVSLKATYAQFVATERERLDLAKRSLPLQARGASTRALNDKSAAATHTATRLSGRMGFHCAR